MKRKTTLDFDELNELDAVKQIERKVKSTTKTGSYIPIVIPYREYFGAMTIEPETMETRIDLANQIEDVMLWVFAYWIVASEAGMSIEELKQDAIDKLTSVIAKHTKLDPYLETHIEKVVNEVIDTTIKHSQDEDTTYWTSPERAMLIAENETNAFENYVEYRDAARNGKTTKKWITELDDRVRINHQIAEGQTVDIDGLFLVGDSLMRFPMDTMYDADPRETINCRCSVIYE